MLFNSTQFLLFLPTVAAVHFLLPRQWRWVWMLLASYAFYMAWEPAYVLLLMLSTGVDYTAARVIGATKDSRVRRLALAASLCIGLGLLFLFKYYNFFRESAAVVLGWVGLPMPLPPPAWLLPVGISFYTFQSLAYLIDVYRGHLPPERNLARFALYVSFFPQLVAGPIERATGLIPQLRIFHDLDYTNAVEGLRRMLWGFFKKVVVADRLAIIVNTVYAAPDEYSGPALALATIAFAFQIYCDFSGYSDIALGVAQIFGIRLMENFRQPYFAQNLGEFWGRWHISLSTWFRDYLYVPLGGNRVRRNRHALNLLLVFLISGLWHGAAWTYVCWGLVHGIGVVVERFLVPAAWLRGATRTGRLCRMALTFLLVNLAWVFFRARSMEDALHVLQGLPHGWLSLADTTLWQHGIERLGVFSSELLLAVALVGAVLAGDAYAARGTVHHRLNAWPRLARWALYSAALWAIFLWGVLRQQEFIYFQF